MKLIPPVSYQGGKQRIASQILDIISPDFSRPFYDLCCGSGAISIELVNRGFPPSQLTMLDKSPWGLFWKMVGNGTFDLQKFYYLLDELPKDVSQIQDFIKKLSKRPANQDTAYVYLILQAAAFGGKAIWIENNHWKNCSFRSYWLPTAISRRRSPTNPMMPMPQTLFTRTKIICEKMYGIHGHYDDISTLIPSSTVYIDPPYRKTTCYGHTFDVMEYVKKLLVKCYISEGVALSEKNWKITGERSKGGMFWKRKFSHEEWLSEFNSEMV